MSTRIAENVSAQTNSDFFCRLVRFWEVGQAEKYSLT